MKRVKRITLFLALVMLFVPALSGCKKKEDDKDKIHWELGEEGRAAAKDNLPDDLDYDGYEVLAFYRGGLSDEAEGGRNEDGADPVEAIVYSRNRKIEDRLNVKLTWIPSDGGLDTTTDEITKILNTNQYYDFILTSNNTIVHRKKNMYLCDLDGARYLDFSQDWWWSEYMDEMAYDGVSYNYAVGDLNISNFKKLSAMYFNTSLIESQLKMTAADFYKMVDDKTWTIEKFYALTKQCYKDTDIDPNKSGEPDQKDIFGFAWSGRETVQQMIFSTSIVNNLYERKDDFTVTLNLSNNSDIQDLCKQMTELIHNNDGAWDRRINDEVGPSDFDGKILDEFSKNNYVFLVYRLGGACTDYLRNMTNFGIIPYPTLHEGDDYISYGETSATCLCIPLVVKTKDGKELDRAGAVLEALCAESYRYTIDAFYKQALQIRYTRDPDSVRMIDKIYDSRKKSFIIEYNAVANNVLSQIYNAIKEQAGIESMLASTANSAQSSLNYYIREMLLNRA